MIAILHSILENDSVLIFSESMLGLLLLKRYVTQEKWEPTSFPTSLATFHSGTAVHERELIVKRLNAQPQQERMIIFITRRTGGEGLNLQGANHVIHLEPYWIPSPERQAFARVHHTGQTKECWEYSMVCESQSSCDPVIQKIKAMCLEHEKVILGVGDDYAGQKAIVRNEILRAMTDQFIEQ